MNETPTQAWKVDLSGQVAVVTGASQGLGRAMAMELAPVGLAWPVQDGKQAGRRRGGHCPGGRIGGSLHLRRQGPEASIRRSIEVAEKWGRLDILINNAGVTRDTLLPRMATMSGTK